MSIPYTLEQRLRSKKVVPFIGAGVSIAVRDSQTHEQLFPSWKQLLQNAATRLQAEGKHKNANLVFALLDNDPPDFLEAAKRARDGLGPIWFDFLKENLNPSRERIDDESLKLAECIWELGSNLLITTNYDKVLSWACPQPANLDIWNIEAAAEQIIDLREGTQRPTVWHLHGFIGKATSIILTPDGYSHLYPEVGNLETHYRAALETLRIKLASSSFLFIGFSLADEYFGFQLRAVSEIFQGTSGPHYVLAHLNEEERIKSLGLAGVEVITFPDFGESQIDLLKVTSDIAKMPERAITRDRNTILKINSDIYNLQNYIFSVPYRCKGNQVIGRDDVIQAIRKQLVEGIPTNIGQATAFQGLGGLGKTQLAVEYAHRFKDSYPNGIIWLNADQDLDAQLIKVADEGKWIAPESEPKDKLAVALNRLKTYSDCLLIFDNLEKFNAIENYLPEPKANPHIIVTSRVDQPNFIPIFIETLNEPDSLKLLIQEAGRSSASESETTATLEIVRALDGLPLALELAGAYLKHRPTIKWSEYHDLLKQNLRRALPGNLGSFTKHEADLYSTLRVSEELFSEEPKLREILDLLSWSGSAPMGEGLMCALLDVSNPTELINALSLGTALRLLHHLPDSNSYSIHRLVAQVHRESIHLSERVDWVKHVCNKLGDWFEELKDEFNDLPKFDAEVNHLQTWQKHAVEYAPEQASRLTWLQVYPVLYHGRYRESKSLVNLAQEQYRTLNNNNKELEASLLLSSAYLTSELGEHSLAKEEAQKALSIRLEVFGKFHLDTAEAYSTLGDLYKTSQQYKQALMCQEEGFEIRKKILGISDNKTAESMAAVGYLWGRLGNKNKSLSMLNEALEISQTMKGDKHLITAKILNDIGLVLTAFKDYQGGRDKHEEALRFAIDAHGDKHPNVATALSNLSHAHQNTKNFDLALEYAQRALSIRMELLGERAHATCMSLYNIGAVYFGRSEFQTAIHYFEKVYNIERKLYGDGDIFTIRSSISLANTLSMLNQRDKAYEIVDKALRAISHTHRDYSELKQLKQTLLSKPLRPGFRQPNSKSTQRRKKKKKH